MHVLRLVLIGIAIGVAIILGVRFVGGSFTGPQIAGRETAPAAHVVNLSPEAARSAVEDRLKQSGEYARFFKTVHEQFPADYERIMNGFSVRAQTALALSPDVYLAEALRGLRQSQGVLASKASVGALEKVFAYQARIINTLAQSNPRLCADFLYGNAAPGFFEFSSKNRVLVAEMAEASLEAILEGRSLGIDRAPPADKDFSVLEAELERKGLGKAEIEALLDGKTPEPALSDAAMCRAGVVYFETLRALPADVRQKIYALTIRLMARG